MNEYLNEVVDHLQEIPEDDRFDLIQYYEEYFLDSGKTLDQIIDEYGTPKQFALKLKISYFSEEEQAENELVKNPKRQIRLIWLIIIGLFASPVLIH
ncbi:membrane protein [Enterococcus faecium]|nr:membrane protein [Enterococcus faecium]